MGLVQGNGVNFEPEREMTFAETVKMLVCALGYKVAAESAGGYPAGYISVAAGHGLLAGYSAGGGNAITNAQLSRLLYRALEVPVVQSLSLIHI